MRTRLLSVLALALLAGVPARAATLDWPSLETQALERLRFYIKIPSVNPPGDSRAATVLLAGWLEQEGIEVQTFASSDNKLILVARLPGRDHTDALLLLHHTDVPPVDASRWQGVDPFGAEIRDGYLYGRGSIDAKSLGILQLTTVVALKRSGLPLAHDVILVSTPDELSGGRAIAWMTGAHRDPIAARYVLSDGGVAAEDLLSSSAKMTFAVAVAEKAPLWVRLRAHGGQGAVEHLLDAIARLQALTATGAGQPSRLVLGMKAHLGTLADNPLTRSIELSSVAVTSLRAGVGDPPRPDGRPAEAEATLDFQLLPDLDGDAFLNSARRETEALGVELQIIRQLDRPPVSSSDTPLYRSLERAALKSDPRAVIVPYLVPFVTDGNRLRVAGADCYGFNPIHLTAELVLGALRGEPERIPVDALAPALHCYYDAVSGYVLEGATSR